MQIGGSGVIRVLSRTSSWQNKSKLQEALVGRPDSASFEDKKHWDGFRLGKMFAPWTRFAKFTESFGRLFKRRSPRQFGVSSDERTFLL